MNFKNMRIGIIGLGIRTGVVSAKIMTELGAKVIVSDVKPAKQLKAELALLQDIPEITYDLGGHSDKVLAVDLLILSPGVPIDIPILQKARELGIEMIAEVELSYRLAKAPFIAITGTNGKTTTTALIGKLLESYPHRVFVGGNIGRPLIGEVLNLSADDLVVAEVSSFQLETVEQFHPWIALFLNLTPDHLDRHKTLEAYKNAKMNIFKNQTQDDIIILNADDKLVSELSLVVPSEVYWFSRKKVVTPGSYLDGEMIVTDLGDGPVQLVSMHELKIRGLHNIENVLAASTAAAFVGVSYSRIREGLRDFRGQEHTLEFVLTHAGVQYYNDSKGTNPDASIKALEAFHEPVILIAGGLNRNLDYSDLMRLVVAKVKALVLIGETRLSLKQAAEDAGFLGKIILADDLREAVFATKSYSEPGDVVLLSPACASWDMFANYAERGSLFKDYVRDMINDL